MSWSRTRHITPNDFRAFTFSNAVKLWGTQNPSDSIRAEIKKFRKELAPYNRMFLEMCLKEYSNYLKGWLAKPFEQKLP